MLESAWDLYQGPQNTSNTTMSYFQGVVVLNFNNTNKAHFLRDTKLSDVLFDQYVSSHWKTYTSDRLVNETCKILTQVWWKFCLFSLFIFTLSSYFVFTLSSYFWQCCLKFPVWRWPQQETVAALSGIGKEIKMATAMEIAWICRPLAVGHFFCLSKNLADLPSQLWWEDKLKCTFICINTYLSQ